MAVPRALTLFGLLALETTAFAQFQFTFDAPRQRWVLQNDRVRAVFQLTAASTFEFRSLTDLAAGDFWIAPLGVRSSPILFRAGGLRYDASSQFRLVSHAAQAIPRHGYRQTIVLDDLRGYGRITVRLEMYDGQPVLRYRVLFTNLNTSSATVTLVDVLPWNFSDGGGSFRALRVNQWVKAGREGNFEPLQTALDPFGMAARISSGAHGQHCGWLAFRDARDRGLFAGWEFDGRATVTLRHLSQSGMLQLAGPIDEINHQVASGEEFPLPAAFLGPFRGDWDEAGYRTQRFVEAAIAKPIPDPNFPYVIWDSWKYLTAIDEATLRRNAEIAAKLGVEVFVIDLGWARQIGDWRADPAKFPSGMRALSDYVHSLGMKFGLHFALAEAMQDSPVLREHPDWTSSETYGYFEALSLCLSHRPVREWLTGETLRMIRDYNLDWILQDGENMVKVCRKDGHTHDPGDSNYANAVEGINALVSAVQAVAPQVVWENCEDGGNMMTYNMVRQYTTSIAADDSGPLTTRQAVYGITYPFPPRYADRYMPDEELTPYVTRSYMFGGPWIFMNRLAQMRQQDLDLAATEVALYKSLRRRIRDGQVFHLTTRPDGTHVEAIESYHHATDRATVFVFRPDTGENSVVRLLGLKAAKTYRVRFQDDHRVLSMTGAMLMENGVVVPLPVARSAEIVYVE